MKKKQQIDTSLFIFAKEIGTKSVSFLSVTNF